MRDTILIVGQGLAGTLLGWEFERIGVPFEIVDQGHARAASRVAAGIINPITGRRFVKSWRVEQLLPFARETYLRIERQLGVRLWHDLRVHRLFADDCERQRLANRQARGLVGEYIRNTDAEGCWIEDAARVDLPALLAASRCRWLGDGRLTEARAELATLSTRDGVVIDCRGAQAATIGERAQAQMATARAIPWRVSKGECLDVAMGGLEPGVVINRGHWLIPIGEGAAKFGSTHEPGNHDPSTTAAGRAQLATSLAALAGQPFTVTNHEAGLRVYLDDKRPLVGRHSHDQRWGFFNALGAKGTLTAPDLARQWGEHLMNGRPFDREVNVARCWPRP